MIISSSSSSSSSSNSGVGGGVGGLISSVGLWGSGDDSRRIAILVTAMAGIALAATILYSRRKGARSPWSRQRRKCILSPKFWRSMFTPEGRLNDGGVKFLKKVQSGGVDPSIRAEVWPFLLGVNELNSSDAERGVVKTQNRKKYEDLRRQVRMFVEEGEMSPMKSKGVSATSDGGGPSSNKNMDSPSREDVTSARKSFSSGEIIPDLCETDPMLHKEDSKGLVEAEEGSPITQDSKGLVVEEEGSPITLESKGLVEEEGGIPITQDSKGLMEEEEESIITHVDTSVDNAESLVTESSDEESDGTKMLEDNEDGSENPSCTKTNSVKVKSSRARMSEDFSTWQRIIRLDAVRANAEWIPYSPAQASVPEERARCLADEVGLKDFDHLEPCRIFHAARLVAILEAYALYDPEIGYCQGMSDLLAPIIVVMEEDYEAFWCFVGFMKKARHNFRLDEAGIRRQLNLVSKIIKSKDPHLFRHLEMLQAEDCFFVYRMVVVLFRRELTFEQTLCLWEVMWADQAAIRAGIGKSAWRRVRLQAPPTEDLLLYAIAACVLQRRKVILEKYNSMDEIIRECNNMAGQLDVWKLLDDAHDLVVTLHERI